MISMQLSGTQLDLYPGFKKCRFQWTQTEGKPIPVLEVQEGESIFKRWEMKTQPQTFPIRRKMVNLKTKNKNTIAAAHNFLNYFRRKEKLLLVTINANFHG